MKWFMYRNERHYTQTHITQLELSPFGFNLCALWWSRCPHGGQGHLRLCLLTMIGLHLFYNYPNHLGRYAKGWEFVMNTYRYGWWLNWVANWSFGYGGSNYKHTEGPQANVVWRLGKWGFVDHNSRYVFPEFVPEDYDGPEPEWVDDGYVDEPDTCPECGNTLGLYVEDYACLNKECGLGKKQREALRRQAFDF